MPQIALPYFNLLDEEWIPAVMRDGERKKLGLLELFRRADAVRVVEHPSPLATAALHRLLLAVLYRSLTPKDGDGVADWFADGWPAEKITGYLEKWRERFYLFHETHPFWQVAEFETKERESWSRLAAEHNASNSGGKILFDHPAQWENVSINPSEATCWLVATQLFALEGGRGYCPSPSSFALLMLPFGKNLLKTLLLNFFPQKRDVSKNDFPVWERTPETKADFEKNKRRTPKGYADLYTWTSRAVHLCLGDNRKILHIGFKSAIGLDKESEARFHDPMAAYNKDDFPVSLQQRGLWREFDSLLPPRTQVKSDCSRAPLVLEQVALLCKNAETISVIICCQKAKNITMKLWRMEQFLLPPAVLDDSSEIRVTIKIMLEYSEYYATELRRACKELLPEQIRNDSSSKGKDNRGLRLEQMPCTAVYWNHLEHAFKQNLEHGFTDPEQAQKLWRGKIRDALALAWDAQRNAVGDGDAWTIRAMTKAGGIVGNALKELTELLKGKQDAVGKEE